MAKTIVDKVLVQAVATAIVHGGARLMQITPLRTAAVCLFEKRLMRGVEQLSAQARYPRGVREDRAAMGLALVHGINRGLTQHRLAPAVLHYASCHLADNVLHDPGDRQAVDRFCAQYGTNPPGFLAISTGKACNLRCDGYRADAEATAAKLEWPIFDRIITEAKELGKPVLGGLARSDRRPPGRRGVPQGGNRHGALPGGRPALRHLAHRQPPQRRGDPIGRVHLDSSPTSEPGRTTIPGAGWQARQLVGALHRAPVTGKHE